MSEHIRGSYDDALYKSTCTFHAGGCRRVGRLSQRRVFTGVRLCFSRMISKTCGDMDMSNVT